MEKPNFEALVKNISTEEWDYDLAIAGTSPSGIFSCGKEDVIELLDHVWNDCVVPLESENKALREEINALNVDIQSYRNGHEANAKRYNDLLIERNKLKEEIERLKAEVLKEKFPEN